VPEAPAAPGRGRTPANRGRAAAPRRSSVAKNDHLESGRAYRKAPELPELEAVYLETGTIAGVAEHFDVPVHTAQGWITRMRRKKRSPANG
ncbi:MAG TPA: hypothetical protein VJT31_05290, partial [Rugosimonospora sp.]|nr:hypothetical protein [Rugosimonospora sp.]